MSHSAYFWLTAVAFAFACVNAASPGRIGPENEIGLLNPPSFIDHTLSEPGALDVSLRADIGQRVASRLALSADPAGPTLEVLNGTLQNLTDGSWIWIRVTNPAAINASKWDLKKEWVGVFPSGIPANDTVPVKYTLLTKDPSYADTGVSVIHLRLINMRVPFDIVFFQNCEIPKFYYHDTSIHKCEATLRVGPLGFTEYNTPLRPAVLVTSDPTKVRIVWTSASTSAPFVDVRYLGTVRPELPFVRPAPANLSLYTRVEATGARAFSRDQLCGPPAATYGFFDPGMRNTATVTNLTPGSWYAYRFGDGSLVSEEYVVRIPPAADPNASVTLFTFGDLGRGNVDGTLTWTNYGDPALNTSLRMSQYISETTVDGIFHIGDLSYATGFLSIWDTYAEMMTSTLAHQPYAVLVGNHESDVPVNVTPSDRVVTFFNLTDSGGECSVPTNGWYPMPWKSVDAPWFSYNVGPVHVIGMSSEHDFFVGSEQYQWMEADLAAVNRNMTPWILFGGHRPMYIDSTYTEGWPSDGNVMDMLIQHVEPLLLRYDVDIAIWGHNHVVQRFCLLRDRECVASSEGSNNTFYKNSGGIVHLVVGAAGAAFTKNVHNPWLPMTENAFYEYGYSLMKFDGGERLTWQWFDNNDAPGVVKDSIVIVKGTPPASPQSSSGLSHGAVAGIVVGCAAAFIAAVLVAIQVDKRRHSGGEYRPLHDSA